jgi:DNA-binding NarL/FixJ family response regulator
VAIVVAVAGASDVITEGLRHILGQAPDLEVMRAYPILLARASVFPDVVLYDAGAIQHDDGVELEVIVKAGGAAVVVVGRELRPSLAARAAALGAVGYVSVDAPASCIVSVIRRAAAGEISRPPALGGEAGLTAREVDVLGDIVKGLSNVEIGRSRSLSHNTVKSYIRGTYRKIGVTSRAQAVSWGLSHGFEQWIHDREETLLG